MNETFPTRPGDTGDASLLELVESYQEHRWWLLAIEHRHEDAQTARNPETYAAHALAELAIGTELVTRVESGRWATAVDALSAGATVGQVGAATGTDPDDVPVSVGMWAAEQRRHGHISDDRYEAVMTLLRWVMPS